MRCCHIATYPTTTSRLSRSTLADFPHCNENITVNKSQPIPPLILLLPLHQSMELVHVPHHIPQSIQHIRTQMSLSRLFELSLTNALFLRHFVCRRLKEFRRVMTYRDSVVSKLLSCRLLMPFPDDSQ